MRQTRTARAVELLCLAWMASSSTLALAAEGNNINYPQGNAGFFIGGFPPIPGIFAVNQAIYAFSNGVYGDDGKKLPGSFHLEGQIDTVRLLASYPVEVNGVRFYSQLVVPLGGIKASFVTAIPFASFANESYGQSNITITPLIVRVPLSKDDVINFELDFTPDFGSYTPTHQANFATGYASLVPVVTYRHSTPNGLDFGFGQRVLFNFANPATGYRTGTVLTTDFIAAYNIGNWNVGAVGGYATQIDDDHNTGVHNYGRYNAFNVGPSLTYKSGGLVINANYQAGVYARNAPKTSYVSLNVAFSLYAPPPPPKQFEPAPDVKKF